jgi:hypothetical protein
MRNLKERAMIEESFSTQLREAVFRLGTVGVFDILLATIGGREIVRLAAALSAKEVKRYLDEPQDGVPPPLPHPLRVEMERIIAVTEGRIVLTPELLHRELAELAVWQHGAIRHEVEVLGDNIDEISARDALLRVNKVLAIDLHELYHHMSDDPPGGLNSLRVKFVDICLRYLGDEGDEHLSRSAIRELAKNHVFKVKSKVVK